MQHQHVRGCAGRHLMQQVAHGSSPDGAWVRGLAFECFSQDTQSWTGAVSSTQRRASSAAWQCLNAARLAERQTGLAGAVAVIGAAQGEGAGAPLRRQREPWARRVSHRGSCTHMRSGQHIYEIALHPGSFRFFSYRTFRGVFGRPNICVV